LSVSKDSLGMPPANQSPKLSSAVRAEKGERGGVMKSSPKPVSLHEEKAKAQQSEHKGSARVLNP